MEGKDSLKLKSSLILYIVFLVGAAGYYVKDASFLFETLTPFVLFGTGVLAIADSGIYKDRHFLLWMIITFVIIFTIEIAGASTGLIFGNYSYGNILGFKLFGVPLIIGFNWLMILLSSFALASSISLRKTFLLFFTPAFAIIIDLFMEPVAMKLGFWNWENNVIPFQNYAAWFLISMAVTYGLIFFNLKFKKPVFISYYFSLLLFFLILNLV